MSDAFQAFLHEAPEHAGAWMEAVQRLGAASALDDKTAALAYLAVLAATRLTSGVPFHAGQARALGASRDEVISAVLVGLPAVGNAVTQALPAALAAFDAPLLSAGRSGLARPSGRYLGYAVIRGAGGATDSSRPASLRALLVAALIVVVGAVVGVGGFAWEQAHAGWRPQVIADIRRLAREPALSRRRRTLAGRRPRSLERRALHDRHGPALGQDPPRRRRPRRPVAGAARRLGARRGVGRILVRPPTTPTWSTPYDFSSGRRQRLLETHAPLIAAPVVAGDTRGLAERRPAAPPPSRSCDLSTGRRRVLAHGSHLGRSCSPTAPSWPGRARRSPRRPSPCRRRHRHRRGRRHHAARPVRAPVFDAPILAGDTLVWQRSAGQSGTINAYDLRSLVGRVVASGALVGAPDFDGTTVVWAQCAPSGAGCEIDEPAPERRAGGPRGPGRRDRAGGPGQRRPRRLVGRQRGGLVAADGAVAAMIGRPADGEAVTRTRGVGREQLLFWCLLELWVLNVADLLLTRYALWLGFATEENDVMRYFLHEGTLLAAVFKIGIVTVGVAGALARAAPPGRAGRRRAADRGLRRRRRLSGGLGRSACSARRRDGAPACLCASVPGVLFACPSPLSPIFAHIRATIRSYQPGLQSTMQAGPGILQAVLPVPPAGRFGGGFSPDGKPADSREGECMAKGKWSHLDRCCSRPRRRRRRHPVFARPSRGRIQGLSGRKVAGARRPHVATRQDLPHQRLLHVHAGSQAGRSRASPEHRDRHQLRAHRPRGQPRQLQSQGLPPRPFRRPRPLHELRRVRPGLPGGRRRPVQRRARRAQGHLQALPAGHPQHLCGHQEGPFALQARLRRAHLGARLRSAHRPGALRRRVPRRERAQPLPRRLRPGLHPQVRDRLHARRDRAAHRHRRSQALRRRLRLRQRAPARARRGHLHREGRHRGRRPERPVVRPRPGAAGLPDHRVRGQARARRHAALRHSRVPPAQGRPAARHRPHPGARRRAAVQQGCRRRLHHRLAARRRLPGRLHGGRPAGRSSAAHTGQRPRGRLHRGRPAARRYPRTARRHGQERGRHRRRRRGLRRRPHGRTPGRRARAARLHRRRRHHAGLGRRDRRGPRRVDQLHLLVHADRRGGRPRRPRRQGRVHRLHPGRGRRARLAPAGAP